MTSKPPHSKELGMLNATPNRPSNSNGMSHRAKTRVPTEGRKRVDALTSLETPTLMLMGGVILVLLLFFLINLPVFKTVPTFRYLSLFVFGLTATAIIEHLIQRGTDESRDGD